MALTFARLATRVALVTGASRGIGASIAHQLAAAGFNVAVSSRSLYFVSAVARDLARVSDAGDDLRHMPIMCDVTDSASINTTVEQVRRVWYPGLLAVPGLRRDRRGCAAGVELGSAQVSEELGNISVLVNCAGNAAVLCPCPARALRAPVPHCCCVPAGRRVDYGNAWRRGGALVAGQVWHRASCWCAHKTWTWRM